MPPKKPPSQAGKFKPLKRPVKKSGVPAPAVASSASVFAGSASSSAAAGAGRGRGRGGHIGGKSPPRDRQDGRGAAAGGRGGGRGGRGRGSGRGGGRGGRGRGGRGGRFIVPTGAAFFTGEAAKRSDAGGPSVAGGAGPSQEMLKEAKVKAGTDGAVFMPGMAGRGGGGGGGAGASSNSRAARSAAESMAAAARAKAGEGEEIIVAEMMDLDEDEDGGKKKSVLDGPSNSRFDGLPSLFDDENQNNEDAMPDHGGVAEGFMYDSDSSAEERRARLRKGGGDFGGGGFRMPPTQLPFPVAPHQQTMYDCQEVTIKDEEKKMSDVDAAIAAASTAATISSKLSDPHLQSPFLDLESVSDQLKQLETNSWFLMKFPTRLPHLDTSSSSANASKSTAAVIKSELSEKSGARPEAVGSSDNASMASSTSAGAAASAASSSGALGYDDTLKDAAAGRYGRIVVRRSGRTELVIGGGEDGPEVRLLVHEGLQCGFRQEAVCIDPDESTFVGMGRVDKSLIVTPDIDRAFVFS